MSPLPQAQVLVLQPEQQQHLAEFPLEDKLIPLDSNIFTDNGNTSILHMVQMARIFPDSKTFVDMKIKESPMIALNNFNNLMTMCNQVPSVEQLAQYVAENFTMDNQMDIHIPDDWIESPKMLENVEDAGYKKFASDLNDRWKILGRKISENVKRQPDNYSLIYLPHPVIVPGGRFGEIYYWDSFWIIRGLLLCDMRETVKGMLRNFIHFIRMYGKIPNGGRTYFTNRSQPPMFSMMVEEYVNETGDDEFLQEALPYMIQEFQYWIDEHFVTVTKDGKQYQLGRYDCKDPGPRPESYVEDFHIAQHHAISVDERENFYLEMKAGAESGWDYSSRWMINEQGTNIGGLEHTKIRYLLPVDLNSFLFKNATILAKHATEDAQKQKFADIAENIKAGINDLLWNEEDGIWYDYDMLHHTQRKYYTPSNLVPLWSGGFSTTEQVSKAVSYLISQNLCQYPGGVPTTYTTSGEQWDFPNCWPPLEHMIVQGLEKTSIPEAKDLAFEIAKRRVESAFANFEEKGHMFEKYNCEEAKRIGGGGEYEIQIGFGWSNGVVLDFLNTYGSRLKVGDLN